MSFRIAIFPRLLAALRCGLALPAIALSLGLAACDPQPPMTANTLQQPSQNTQTLRMAEYRVAPGDRVRVVVLSDPELSGEYEIDFGRDDLAPHGRPDPGRRHDHGRDRGGAAHALSH